MDFVTRYRQPALIDAQAGAYGGVSRVVRGLGINFAVLASLGAAGAAGAGGRAVVAALAVE